MALPKPRWRDPVFWSTALRLTLPVAIQNLLVSSFALVDTLMVGQLGDVPLSAIGMATQWAWFLISASSASARGPPCFMPNTGA